MHQSFTDVAMSKAPGGEGSGGGWCVVAHPEEIIARRINLVSNIRTVVLIRGLFLFCSIMGILCNSLNSNWIDESQVSSPFRFRKIGKAAILDLLTSRCFIDDDELPDAL